MLQVFEGERAKSQDNHHLGRFDLTGIKQAPRGQPQIEVTFEVDVNGMLKVSAQDKDTGIEKNIVIDKSDGSLSGDEIERMIREAEEFEKEDQKFKETTEAKNSLEGLAYTTKKQLEDKDKIFQVLTTQEVETVSEACDDALSWINSNADADLDQILEKKNILQTTIHPIISKLYKDTAHDREDL